MQAIGILLFVFGFLFSPPCMPLLIGGIVLVILPLIVKETVEMTQEKRPPPSGQRTGPPPIPRD